MDFSAFQTLAEVSAGFTGFVGVILAIRSRTEPLARLQLIGFLLNSLGVVVFSLVPEMLVGFFGENTLNWRVLCLVLAVYHLGIMINHVRTQRGLLQMSWFQKLVTAASVPVIALKLVVVMGYLTAYAANVYYLALLWHLWIAIYIFSQILLFVCRQNLSDTWRADLRDASAQTEYCGNPCCHHSSQFPDVQSAQHTDDRRPDTGRHLRTRQ